MKRLVEFFVRQPIFGDLLTVVVIIVGVYTAVTIRREAFPNVSYDTIQISTLYPGATPEEVEKLITNPIEQDLTEVDGVKRMTSASVDGLSNIYLTLDSDQTTVEDAKEDVKSIIDQITDFPESAKKTIVKDLESKQVPIIELSISSATLTRLELRDLAKQLEKDLEKIKGVAKIALRGVQNKEIRIEVDSKKLSYYRLSLDEVALSLRKQNSSTPAGKITPLRPELPELEKSIRTIGDFNTVEDVQNTVIRSNEAGKLIKISDIAKVKYALEEQKVINFTNGNPSLSLTVIKKEMADAITVVEKVQSKVKELKEKSYLKNIETAYINDNSEFIQRRLGVLTGNLTLGLGLVLLLLPLMLPFRFAAIIAMGEPFAFLGALILLYMIGGSLNLISMMGLIIVSGILVDDSIVVTENAVRLIEEEGMSPQDAAITGTMQIMAPVTASVLTTSFAFLPMAFMSGVFGKFIKEIPIAVLTCMAISLLETYFILPGHVAHWIKPKHLRKVKKENFLTKFTNYTNSIWETKMVPIYINWLRFALRKRYWMALGLVGLLVGTLLLATKGMKFILFPPEGVEIFFIRTEAETGTGLDRHAYLLKPIEKIVKEKAGKEIKNYVTMVGIQQQDPFDPTTKRGSEFAQIVVYLTPEQSRDRTAKDVIEALRKEIGNPKEFKKISFNRVNPGPPQGKPVQLGIRGNSYDDILVAVNSLKSELSKINGVTDIADSYTMGKEELRISAKEPEASASYLTSSQIGTTVRAAYEGLIPTSIKEIDEKIDLRVTLTDKDHASINGLLDLQIPNQFGNLIPLRRVTEIKSGRSLLSYQHEGNEREIKLTAEVDTTITTSNEVNNFLRTRVSHYQKNNPNVSIEFGGADEDTRDSMKSLGRAFIVAILGIFLMLVLTFRKLLQPLVVLLTIPLGMIAVVLAFFVHNMPISFMGMLGIIALSGVIVNNAIMLVDFINQARAKGLDRFESIIEAGRMRIRPIFLTTVTTIIGVLPTAYGIGGLDKFVVPIAMALGWGLLFGSILTSFIFPSALAIIDDVSELIKKKIPILGKFYDH